MRKHHEDHFDYAFFSGGVISFYDEAYDSSILQKTNAATDDWKRDGYSCYPEPPYDNTYDLNYNFSECFPAVLSPAIDETVRLNQDYLDNFNKALYYPFGFENEPYPSMAVGTSVTVNVRLGDIYTLPLWASAASKWRLV